MRSVLVSTVVALGMVAAAYADVTVESTGTAKLKPDVAYLTFSVAESTLDWSILDDAVSRRAKDAAEKFSKVSGVRGCEIKPAELGLDLSATLVGEVGPARKIFKGTRVVTVECNPEEAVVHKVMTVAVESGIDLGPNAYGVNARTVTYGVKKTDDGEAQAFADALKKARTKAHRLADQAGLKLGRVTGVAEDGAFPPGYARFLYDGEFTVQYVGTDPQSVQIVSRFKITFETN